MAREIFAGYNPLLKEIYVNDRGNHSSDYREVGFRGGLEDLKAMVVYLAKNYERRNTLLFSDLPEEVFSELERLVYKNSRLQKMKVVSAKKK